ncbi:MAG: hypothetical protein MUO40_09500 [Anaerolineaceae bacterium]|nr:hypothetical protein [Anaerolineaceae bacterium]
MPDHKFSLIVMSPDQILLSHNNVSAINIRLEDGRLLGIRPGHAPLIANTAAGNISYTIDSQVFEMPIPAGILTVRKNVVKILT